MEKEAIISTSNPLIKAFIFQLGKGLISLILFGSRGRGEGSGRSDGDIFILAEDLPDHPFERQIFLREMIPKELSFQVSLYAKTVKEFERDFPAIYLDIAADGIILFDSDNYALRKLQRIREIIPEAGLKRVRRFGSLIWVWEEQPEVGWGIDWSGVYGFKRGSKVPAEAQ